MERITKKQSRRGFLGGMAMIAGAVAIGAAPGGAEAAAHRTISIGSYQSWTICESTNGESSCAKASGKTWRLLKVTGKRFTPSAPVLVFVKTPSAQTVESGSLLTDGDGNFVFMSDGVELADTGFPLIVHAIDVATNKASAFKTVMTPVS